MMRRSPKSMSKKENRVLESLRHPSAFFKKASVFTRPDPVRDGNRANETYVRMMNAHQIGNTGSIGLPR